MTAYSERPQPVLLVGGSRAARKQVARAIHARSARHGGPLLMVACAGWPEMLLESELFGHLQGSFVGAFRDKPGMLEIAAKGTIYLDDIGALTPRIQARLLQVIDTGEIRRLGADAVQARVDVRLIAAANHDLEENVAAGAFRPDLYRRLTALRIDMPSGGRQVANPSQSAKYPRRARIS